MRNLMCVFNVCVCVFNVCVCVCLLCVCVFSVCVCVCVILLLQMMDVFSCSHEEDQKNSSDVHVFYTLLTMEVCL